MFYTYNPPLFWLSFVVLISLGIASVFFLKPKLKVFKDVKFKYSGESLACKQCGNHSFKFYRESWLAYLISFVFFGLMAVVWSKSKKMFFCEKCNKKHEYDLNDEFLLNS